jgi:hypothetical protein
LVLQAYGTLIRFEYYLACRDFFSLHNAVRNHPLNPGVPSSYLAERICAAVEIACICYPKNVLCLQRSAAAACLLKRHGIPAQMVIGTQQLPLKSHAWVEVNGDVVNDKPYIREVYPVMDRC